MFRNSSIKKLTFITLLLSKPASSFNLNSRSLMSTFINPSSTTSTTSSSTQSNSNNLNKILCVYWFRSDLRLTDNEGLTAAVDFAKTNNAFLLPVYVFDSRFTSPSPTKFQALKCNPARARFLIESVADLRTQLEAKGGTLFVGTGKTEDVLAEMIKRLEPKEVHVFTQQEICEEEKDVEAAVVKSLKKNTTSTSTILHKIWGSTLYHLDDLPLKSIDHLPTVFTPFRSAVEKNSEIRALLPDISNTKLKKVCAPSSVTIDGKGHGAIPVLTDLGFTEVEQANSTKEMADPRGVLFFVGGETAAKQRLKTYLWDEDRLKDYFETRNHMIGQGYSTKLSPYLAHGCISPKTIAYECSRYEQERVKNKSTYWVVFELLVRDFCKFFAARFKNKIFHLDGTLGKDARSGNHPNRVKWSLDMIKVEKWRQGLTGFPFVDANMRELNATGYMSNRGRQNVASFFALDMKQDWRYGADHFQETLVDHDVYSNYVSWVLAAGMSGGRVNKFNVVKQAKDYDPEGEYIKLWCPELKNVPTPLLFEPQKMSAAQQKEYGVTLGVDYPSPMVITDSQKFSTDRGDNGGHKGDKNDRRNGKGKNWNKSREGSSAFKGRHSEY